MKTLLTILFFFTLAGSSFAQVGNDSTRYIQYKFNYGTRQPRYWADSVLNIPKDTTFSKFGISIKDSVLYAGDGTRWRAVGVQTPIYAGDGMLITDTLNGGYLFTSTAVPNGVQSVTGLNTDNTDPINPVIHISTDGVRLTGDGTPADPLTYGPGTAYDSLALHAVEQAVDSSYARFTSPEQVDEYRLHLVGGAELSYFDTSFISNRIDSRMLTNDSTASTGFTSRRRTDSVVNLSSRIVVVSNTQLANTGSTTENIVFTGTIPGNSIGKNGSYHMTGIYSYTNNTNTKTYRIKFNGTTVATFTGTVSTANISTYTIIRNRNSLAVQVSGPATATSNTTFNSASGGTLGTYTFDSSANITVTITCQLGTGSDTMNVEGFEIIANH